MSRNEQLSQLQHELHFRERTKDMSPVTEKDYPKFMAVCREEAEAGMAEGGMPIGACVVHLPTGTILGRGRNQRMQQGSRVLHAETDALDKMTLTGEPNGPPVPDSMLPECGMFTTMSPCPMCSGAVINYGLRLVVLAENEHSPHGEPILAQHGVQVVHMHDDEILGITKDWIKRDGGKIWGNKELATPYKDRKSVGNWAPN